VIIEATAVGVPIVSTRVPCGPEVIVGEGETGIFANVHDPVDLADKIRRLLDDREPRRQRYSRRPLSTCSPSQPPKEHRRQLWLNNSLERLNKEIRRRSDVVGIFPDRASIIRLVGAVLAE